MSVQVKVAKDPSLRDKTEFDVLSEGPTKGLHYSQSLWFEVCYTECPKRMEPA